MEILKYKEFEGSAQLDMQRQVCRGSILFIDDVVTYESKSIDGLQKQFEEAVEDYLLTCKQVGKEPQKSCRGQFNVRVHPELHRAATRRALADETTLNDVVCKALETYLSVAASTSNYEVKALPKSVLRTVPKAMADGVKELPIFLTAATAQFVAAHVIVNSPRTTAPSRKPYVVIDSMTTAISDEQELQYAH